MCAHTYLSIRRGLLSNTKILLIVKYKFRGGADCYVLHEDILKICLRYPRLELRAKQLAVIHRYSQNQNACKLGNVQKAKFVSDSEDSYKSSDTS